MRAEPVAHGRVMSVMGCYESNQIREGCRTLRLSTFDQFSVSTVPYYAC